MGGSQDIHQIEYRWQPKTDMTAVATSMSDASIRSWTQRIGPWIRQPAVEAPTESVRYELLGNSGSAAIAWRQRDPRAAMMAEGNPGRPLVSRVLVGPAEVLTAELAMAVCAMGLPDPIGPKPGAVAAGTELPPISGAALTGLVEAMADRLDAAAAKETGLEALIAAALTDRDTPLAVELPDSLIGLPVRSGPQGRLLWGLRRTLRPLLGRNPGRRDWAFSTFEPPLSDVDPGTLGTVFRLMQPAQQAAPMAFRPELRVRPYEPVTRSAETYEQELARLLVAAYLQHGGGELGELLTEWTRDCTTAEHRIDAAHSVLVGNPAAVAAPEVEFRPPAPPAPPPAASSAGGHHEDTRAVSPPTFMSEQARVPLAPDPQDEAPDADFPRRPARLSQLLANLSNPPASSRFDWALRALKAERFETDAADRATARNLLRDHNWYVGTLGRNAQAGSEDILIMIFLHAVLPDLSQPEVTRDLTDWAGRRAAPPVVIKALYAACDGTVRRPELDRILVPVLAGRWLSENGISASPAPPAGRGPAAPSQDALRAGPSAPAQQARAVPRAPLLSKETAVTFLKRRIPVYVALLVAIGLMIVVLVV